MKSPFVVVTPSYAPDFELCKDLHRSVLEHTAPAVVHTIVVPDRDHALFSTLAGPRCVIWRVSDLLPWRFLPIPRANTWLNLRRPLPPVRGWIMQQLVKIAAAARANATTVLLVDSDVILIRPVAADTFRKDDVLKLYRKDAAIDARLPRHVIWHRTAERLLGLPPVNPPLPDYISAFNVWDRETMLALQKRIETVTGLNWMDAIGSHLHFSEFILYGVFVDRVLGYPTNSRGSPSMHVCAYWEPRPLDLAAATAFVNSSGPDDVALMLSAKSRTPLQIRRAAFATLGQKGSVG